MEPEAKFWLCCWIILGVAVTTMSVTALLVSGAKHKAAIEAGYIEAPCPGSSGTLWVKPVN
jgi:hypothetical protein